MTQEELKLEQEKDIAICEMIVKISNHFLDLLEREQITGQKRGLTEPDKKVADKLMMKDFNKWPQHLKDELVIGALRSSCGHATMFYLGMALKGGIPISTVREAVNEATDRLKQLHAQGKTINKQGA